MTKRQGGPLVALTFLSALVLASVLLFMIHAAKISGVPGDGAARITVEHDTAVTLTIVQSTGKKDGLIEFTADAGAMRISIPSLWKRREVRGAPLSAVTNDPPGLGMTRWHVPDGATVSFRTNDSPPLSISHLSTAPLLVIGKRVNVVTGRVEEKSVLLKEGGLQLW